MSSRYTDPRPPTSPQADRSDPPDPRFDFTAATFDAALALSTPGVVLPVPEAPLLDNVSRCKVLLPPEVQQQLLQQAQPNQQQQTQAEEQQREANPRQLPDLSQTQMQERQQQQPLDQCTDNQLADQEQLQRKQEAQAKHEALKARAQRAVTRAESSVPDSLSLQGIMDVVPATSGPLSVLHTWVTQQRRVCVVTRHAAGVRGRAHGTLRAFDRFMNLLLLDVEEHYTVIVKVPRYKQQLPPDPDQVPAPQEQQQQQQQHIHGSSSGSGRTAVAGAAGPHQPAAEAEVSKPGTNAAGRMRVRWCRKQEQRFRRMDQVLVRGDSVVLVHAVAGA